MAITTQLTDQELSILVDGRLDFSIHEEFCATFQKNDKAINSYVIDMHKATHLDSSGLGMMLLLRIHAKDNKAQLRIVKCSHAIKKVLTIASFDRMFVIE